jgi:hypothetical protein
VHPDDSDAGSQGVTALARAGELAVAEALRLWKLDIIDPEPSDKSMHATTSRHRINAMLVAAGWTWAVPYPGNRAGVEWCGLFAGACWRVAGLDPKWLATYWASTYRLAQWARYRAFDERHPNPRPDNPLDQRMVATYDETSTEVKWEPSAGDVLMIGDGQPAMGDHICLVESYDPARRVFSTVEGNGSGLGPDGRRRQGVVRAERRLGGGGYCARMLIRPGFGDLLAERG